MSAPEWDHLDEIDIELEHLAAGLELLRTHDHFVEKSRVNDEVLFILRGLSAIQARLKKLQGTTHKVANAVQS